MRALISLAGNCASIPATRASRAVIIALSAALLAGAIPTGSVAAADDKIVDDRFSRSLSNSWGSANIGGSYKLTGPTSSFSVNGSHGIIVLGSNGTVHQAASAASARDVNLTLTFAVDRLPRAGYLRLAVIARIVDARSHYRYLVRISPTGAVSLRMFRVVDGRAKRLGTTVTPGLRVSVGQQYRLRLRVTGAGTTVLQGKVWSASRTQPSSWNIRRSNSASRLQKAGAVALRVSATGWAPYVPARFALDDFVVRNVVASSTEPPPSTSPNSSADYLLMPRSELLSLPTSGSAWNSLKSVADGSWGSPDLCDQNRKHGAMALAGALVYARTGTSSYYTKVRNAIMSAMGTEKSSCSLLSIGRQLGSYVLAADLIKLSGSDNTSFRSWLDKMRTRSFTFHGRWQVLVDAHADANNNWGSFIGASRIAASLYLGDSSDVATAAKIVRGFFGDRSAYAGFRGQGSKNSALYNGERAWACDSSASGFVPINPACTKSGINIDGAIVGDVYRDDKGLIWPVGTTGISYTLESLQGLTLQAELLYRNGYSGAWGWSSSALRRAAGLVTRNGNAGGPTWNYSSVSYHVPWLLNFRYDLNLPTRSAGYGRIFGYTDWLYGGR